MAFLAPLRMTTASVLTNFAESSPALLHAFGNFHFEHPGIWLALLFLLALANGFFVAADVALHRIHSSQLEDAAEERKPGATYALNLSRRIAPYLAACQIGTTSTTLLLGALGGPLITSWFAPLFARLELAPALAYWLGFLFAILLLTVVQTIACEQIPRTIGYRKTVSTTIACARPLRLFYLLALLPVKLVHFVSSWLIREMLRLEPVASQHLDTTEDDLRIMVEETGRSQVVTETEREILENALELNELCARDIITPRNEVIDLNVHRTFKENLQIAIESKHTRFPLVDGHLDQTLGLVHLKDLLREMRRESPNLFAAKRDLLRVSEKLPLDELLKLFLSRRAHMALVVDQFGGSLGLVTLDDVLDEVVGEINDEFDEEEEPAFRRLDEANFLVEGWVPLHELADEVEDLELESPDVSTIGGYLTSLFGRLPEVGDQIQIEGYLATVEQADDRVVERIRFEKVATEELAEEAVPASDEESDVLETEVIRDTPLETTGRSREARSQDRNRPEAPGTDEPRASSSTPSSNEDASSR